MITFYHTCRHYGLQMMPPIQCMCLLDTRFPLKLQHSWWQLALGREFLNLSDRYAYGYSHQCVEGGLKLESRCMAVHVPSLVPRPHSLGKRLGIIWYGNLSLSIQFIAFFYVPPNRLIFSPESIFDKKKNTRMTDPHNTNCFRPPPSELFV